MTDNPEHLNAEVILSMENINQFKNWNGQAKQYIQELNGGLNIMTLVTKYHDLVNGFYIWFVTRQGQIHQEDVSTLLALQQRLKEQRLSEMITHFTTSDVYSNEKFTSMVLDMYTTNDRKQIEKMPFNKQFAYFSEIDPSVSVQTDRLIGCRAW